MDMDLVSQILIDKRDAHQNQNQKKDAFQGIVESEMEAMTKQKQGDQNLNDQDTKAKI